jgi:hypothetical protein
MYQQPPQQPQASHSASSTEITTGVSGANALYLAQSATLNSAVTVMTEAVETKSSDDLGNYTFDSPPEFTFGATNQQEGGDMMDFIFDPISVPGNEETLAAMRAIQSPNWLENMLMPGSVETVPFVVVRVQVRLILTSFYRFSWPAEETMQDYGSPMRNDIVMNNNYQSFHSQPAEVLLR